MVLFYTVLLACDVVYSTTQCYRCQWKSGGELNTSAVDLPNHAHSALQEFLRTFQFEISMFKSNHTNNVTTTGTQETTKDNYIDNYTANTTEATVYTLQKRPQMTRLITQKPLASPLPLSSVIVLIPTFRKKPVALGNSLVSNIYLRAFA